MATRRAARIWRRTRVGGLLTAVLALVLLGIGLDPSGLAALLVAAVLAVLGALELASLGRLTALGLRAPLIGGVGLSLAAGMILVGADPSAAPTSLAGASRVLAALAAASAAGAAGGTWLPGSAVDARSARRLLAATLGALWIAAPLLSAGPFVGAHGSGALAVLIVLSKFGDVCGYYVGNALGRTHPFPRISPGKTTAGCVGSLVGAVALGGVLTLLGTVHSPYGVLGGLVLGLGVNLAAQAGDLLESVVKRRAKVKDSGDWFGPAGGVLDLVDSLLLSLPVALLLWPLVAA